MKILNKLVKKGKLTKKRTNKLDKASKFVIVIFIGLTILFLYLIKLTYAGNIIDFPEFNWRLIKIEATPTPTSKPKKTLVPTNKVKGTSNTTPVPIINNDPIINCGPGIHSKQYVKDKASNCKNYVDCGLNNNTVWTMMLKSDCDKKHAMTNTNNIYSNTSNKTYTHTPPSYYICTLCYPALGTCTTYNYLYETKSECDAEQLRINSMGGSTNYNTYATPQPTFDVSAYNDQVSQCRRDIIDKYGNIEGYCNAQFGGSSSAYDACVEINTEDRQKEHDACGTTI